MHNTQTTKPLTARQQRWLEEQRGFESSGLSILDFCRQYHINQSTFYKRRERLTELGIIQSRGSKARSAKFIDAGSILANEPSNIRAIESSSLSTPSFEVRLELGAGVVLTVSRR